jgi:serine/threonine protein kinase
MDSFPVQFGRYTLLRTLGHGGMAEAYLARHQGGYGVYQYVCIKTLLKEHQDNETFLRHFEREAKLVSRLHHPNITKVVEFGSMEGQRFLALELVDGIDLGKLHRRMQASGEMLAPELVLSIAVAMAYALDCAHSAQHQGRRVPIMHRDISPSNILLGSNGDVKLSDFGIAKPIDAKATILTQGLVTKGKTPYMAPEYLRGMPFTPQADLYALGVTLYEILTGNRPFDAESTVRIFERASQGDYTPVRIAAPQTPDVLARAIETMLAPSPEQRFASASLLLDALSTLSLSVLGARRLGELVEHYRRADETMPQEPPLPAPEALPKPLNIFALETHTRDDRRAAGSDATRVERPQHGSRHAPYRRFDMIQTLTTRSKAAMAVAGLGLAVLGVFFVYRGAWSSALDKHGMADPKGPLQAPLSAPSKANHPSASLTVMVIPAGQVIIDGKDIGASPVTVQLEPGMHRVVAVNGSHRTEQSLRLSAGQTERAVLRLDLLR